MWQVFSSGLRPHFRVWCKCKQCCGIQTITFCGLAGKYLYCLHTVFAYICSLAFSFCKGWSGYTTLVFSTAEEPTNETRQRRTMLIAHSARNTVQIYRLGTRHRAERTFEILSQKLTNAGHTQPSFCKTLPFHLPDARDQIVYNIHYFTILFVHILFTICTLLTLYIVQ